MGNKTLFSVKSRKCGAGVKMAEEEESRMTSGSRRSARLSNHSKYLQIQKGIEEKRSSNSRNRKLTTF